MSTNAIIHTLVGPVGPQGASGVSDPATISGQSGNITAGSSASISVVIPKVATIMVIETNYPAWVRIYSNAAWRTADAGRAQTTDPVSGTGVMAEIVTIGATLSIALAPAPVFINDDTVLANVAYLSITNNDTVTRNITVTIKFLPMSA